MLGPSGSGKTTLSGHLAVQAQLSGAGPVCLIDIDPQGSLSLWARQREADQARERLAQVLDHEPELPSRAAERLEDEALAGN